MNNMYDILERFNTLSGAQILCEATEPAPAPAAVPVPAPAADQGLGQGLIKLIPRFDDARQLTPVELKHLSHHFVGATIEWTPIKSVPSPSGIPSYRTSPPEQGKITKFYPRGIAVEYPKGASSIPFSEMTGVKVLAMPDAAPAAMAEADVEEGNRFTGELMKARAAGKKQADLDGDGDMEPVREAKKSKPDFLDVDGDGDRKEPFKKAVADRARGKKAVKENLQLIKETDLGDRSLRVYHDSEYQEYHVCIAEGNRVVSRQFAGSSQEASDLVRSIVSEARGTKVTWPGSAEYKEKFGQDRETFRKKHAPSVMKDPKSREELTKLDTEYEAGKKRYGRDDDDSDEEEGKKKDRPAGEKRGRGRPKGSKRAIGAKGPSGRSKLLTREDYDQDEYDEEGEMAQSQARVIADAAAELESMLDANENLPEWVQKKITLAQEYIDSARDYLKSNRPEDSDGEMALPEAQGSFSQADYDKIARKKRHLMMLDRNLEPEDAEEMAAAKLGYDYDEVLAWVNADHDDVKEGSTGDYSAKKARAGRDIGRPGKQFAKIAKSAGERYGSKERGEKVAGAVLAKLRARHDKLDEVDLEEKAVSRAQRAAAGIARAAQKGEIPRSELRGASKEMAQMKPKELSKFAKTREKGLPEKVKEVDTGEADARKTVPASKDQQEKTFARHREHSAKERQDHDKEKPVKETTTAGSVATTPTGGEKKSKGGIQFGKGVYEARLAEQFEREMNTVMAESLDVAITANADGTNTVTVTGKDVAPDVLQDLLQMAGMSGTREPVYQPVEPEMSGGGDMASMLDTLDGLSAGDDMAEPMAEETVCERCGGHEGMHEAGCDREMALEADLANSADRTETMSTDYMVDELAGGLNGPKRQVNPNNVADNPLAMPDLAKSAHNLNLGTGAISEETQHTEDRLLALYRKIAS